MRFQTAIAAFAQGYPPPLLSPGSAHFGWEVAFHRECLLDVIELHLQTMHCVILVVPLYRGACKPGLRFFVYVTAAVHA